MKKSKYVIFLSMFFSTLVYSQEILVLGCEGVIDTETLTSTSTPPNEKKKTSRKITTEIKIDKKNKIIKVQDQQLDVCNQGGPSEECVCNFDENNYECKFEPPNNTEYGLDIFRKKISLGRKTGITYFQMYSLNMTGKDSSYYYSSSTTVIGMLNCEIKKINKF